VEKGVDDVRIDRFELATQSTKKRWIEPRGFRDECHGDSMGLEPLPEEIIILIYDEERLDSAQPHEVRREFD
jgi:hypothetical protein